MEDLRQPNEFLTTEPTFQHRPIDNLDFELPQNSAPRRYHMRREFHVRPNSEERHDRCGNLALSWRRDDAFNPLHFLVEGCNRGRIRGLLLFSLQEPLRWRRRSGPHDVGLR